MSLNVEQLTSQMIAAFSSELGEHWNKVEEYAKTEAKKLAENLVMIEKLRLTQAITEEESKLYFDIQKNATRSVLLTIEGLGLIAVEQAINAAINVLREGVNTALDFALL
ncbi:hypothetical protein ACEUKD_08395 [Vibrio diabolicus]|uniref:hypothetical protein n=1 Tax=Vibrio diabolicus TaxID=50719 RepID=UPI0023EAF4C9|nr:hypothetical protein [Vibrio parahaemolyticus]HDY7896817.1 hypothetical protein [Vibrio vulnificus]